MRIVGGKYRGRVFNPGKTFKARPTTDLAKESLFNILNNIIDFEETKVLDLFAGTGSISYEFLSRGASNITMVELNFKHIQFIKSVLSELNEIVTVYRADVLKFIKGHKDQYDLIFADPPYDHPEFKDIPENILKANLIAPGGLLIIEHPKNFDFSKLPNFTNTRHYGSVHFSFFKNE